MSFSNFSPDFRDALRDLADSLAKKKATAEAKIKPTIKISSELQPLEVIEEIEEGTIPPADNK